MSAAAFGSTVRMFDQDTDLFSPRRPPGRGRGQRIKKRSWGPSRSVGWALRHPT